LRQIRFVLLDEITSLFVLIIWSLFQDIPSTHFSPNQKTSFSEWQANFWHEIMCGYLSPAGFDEYCCDLFKQFLNGCASFACCFCSQTVNESQIKKVLLSRGFHISSNFFTKIERNESEYLLIANSLVERYKNTIKDPAFNKNDVIDRLNAHVAFQGDGFLFSTADKRLLKYLINHSSTVPKDEVVFLEKHVMLAKKE
jgi:hypothetical protein